MAAAGVTTRVSRLTLLLVLFAPLAVGWSADGWAKARGRGETNAGRLTRGLPPLPPRRLYNPSRAAQELHWRADPRLPVSSTARAQLM
ncbi:hypothetical protein CALCODRAFT_151454 [Calocera cornea HHB12733]|uniref:Uncharacterized protein n=1 Tax=Calocera cornea HHB12733 TaxID=1353952 RepID=A0A165CPG8_9BASI|nr:hypothetical protein CALCODRAFT_151454 [Calocera cornea HHB12733]